MIGLQPYERDPELPLQLGDDGLVGLQPEEVLSAIAEHLVRSGADAPAPPPTPTGATLEFARWKPGVSSTWGYRVEFSDGVERTVTVKRYRDAEKVAAVLERRVTDAHVDLALGPLRAVHADPQSRLTLWAFPADRALRGLARALNTHRAARLLEASLGAAGEGLRKRDARAEVLRYKPERRAVIRLKVPRHGGRSTRSEKAVFRVHPVGRARRIAANREACAVASTIGPELLALDEPTGTLVEAWLRGKSAARDAFDHAAEAGALLAELHRCGSPRSTGPEVGPLTVEAATPWLERIAGIGAGELAIPALPLRGAPTWIHGDVHPDQFLFGREGLRLLDLDELSPGDPAFDLATWIADHLVTVPGSRFEDAADSLLSGYAGAGGRIDTEHLRQATAHALVRKAAGCLRRLERDAVDRAREDLARAIAVSQGTDS